MALCWIALRVTDLLNVLRRVHVNKIRAVLSSLFCSISDGMLPFHGPPAGSRAGSGSKMVNRGPSRSELLRSAYAKQLVNQHQVVLRSKALRMHQWSISLPGACEALWH